MPITKSSGQFVCLRCGCIFLAMFASVLLHFRVRGGDGGLLFPRCGVELHYDLFAQAVSIFGIS